MNHASCERCHGTGRRDLTRTERDVVASVGKDWSPTDEIGVRLKAIQGYETRPTALANRLARLLALGLVQRRALDGRSYEWRAP